MAAFYAARNYAPLWTADGQLDTRAKSVIAQLANAAADGLDPADYLVPAFGAATRAEALADADITLTYSALTFARHLATGRIAPSRVVTEVDYGDHAPAPADILSKIAEAADAGAALESFNPPHRGFQALKAKLAELRGHGIPRAQKVSATVDPSKPGQEIDRVLANMERWRWLPRDLGKTYVMVNIPDYSLKVVHDRHEQWHTKIVAGKPQTPTPLLTASMDTVLVNPSWHVPQSIIKNELLPRYGRDPNIFARMGLEVKRHPDGTLNVTQPPGARNALGRIKFNFSNKFSVYLHDTPDRSNYSPPTSARSATAACGWKTRPSSARSCCAWRWPVRRRMRNSSATCSAARSAPSSSPTGRWCTSPTRPPSSTIRANCSCARMSTASTSASGPSCTATSV